jgi:hypothetical protein
MQPIDWQCLSYGMPFPLRWHSQCILQFQTCRRLPSILSERHRHRSRTLNQHTQRPANPTATQLATVDLNNTRPVLTRRAIRLSRRFASLWVREHVFPVGLTFGDAGLPAEESVRHRRVEKSLTVRPFFVSTSAFQPVSVGLGYRLIPALGGGAQQFQP